MEPRIKYAIGEQSFKSLRERECMYIDKTEYIHKIVTSGSKYYFLARPRRFGKSLFLSAMKSFFEGDRELFKGLYIDSTDWDWQPYPVMRLDLNMERYAEPGLLEHVLDFYFRKWEEKYDIQRADTNHSQRFAAIIRGAHEKTGRKVVVLVDEYDKPLVGNLNRDDTFEHYRAKLASLYTNFKSCADHIRLVFLTGVSRFSKLSVFSDLNNLNDITFEDEFADICGITEKEMLNQLSPSIHRLAVKNDITYLQACEELKRSYDGYRFAKAGSDIYNPWSLISCLDKSEIENYWNRTGLPTIIVESLQNIDADLEESFNTQCTLDTLTGLDLKSPNPLALLYQTGYLTIKEYDRADMTYTLGIPNREVREGLFNHLLPAYVKVKRGLVETTVFKINQSIRKGDPDTLMKELQAYFAGIPYELRMDNENNFHNAFYILLTLIGIRAKAEVSVSDGRIDLLIQTSKFVYIVELKYDGSPEAALRQIDESGYALPYQTDRRKLFKIGVNFSSKTRRIENWKIADN